MARSAADALLARVRSWWGARQRVALTNALVDAAPLELQLLGRTLFHAGLVGLGAGIVGVLFFVGLELTQMLVLEGLAGYRPLRAHGEGHGEAVAGTFRPWLLVVIPALGGLLCGLVTRLAPETAGGGADAIINAFHHRGGAVRWRVVWVKVVASILTLGTGGAGGREGPTMQIGGALGSLIGRLLNVSARERRILLVAGIAAGIAAVFRTPLGAALLAVEILYKDGFESEALIPAVLSSVISYSVVISVLGETTMFTHAPHFPFVPAHLVLYGLLAICTSVLARAFIGSLGQARALAARLPGPAWIRPGVGGLLLGVLAVPLVLVVGEHIGRPGQGLGVLGGGYGAVQVAISGAAWFPVGWTGVWLLALLCLAKMVASSATIGSGGSAGDFAPSLALGGLLGGAFGRAAGLLIGDPRIDAGAFALVGMGAFYGGIAHVPLAALVLVCELCGSYDLLVPLMLAQGIAFVLLRKHTLYDAQVASPKESPVHREAFPLEGLKAIPLRELADVTTRRHASFVRATPASEMLRLASELEWQDVFPVLDGGAIVGIVTGDALRHVAAEHDSAPFVVAADVMQAPAFAHIDDTLHSAARVLIARSLRELPLVDNSGHVVGFLDETHIAKLMVSRLEEERFTPAHGMPAVGTGPPRTGDVD